MAAAAATTALLDRAGSSYCLATFPSRRSARHGSCVRIVCRSSKRTTDGGTGTKRLTFGGTRKKIKDEESEDDEEFSNGALNFGTQLLNLVSKPQAAAPKEGESKKELVRSLGLLRRAPDARTVFVAGATGQIGARLSQQLLRSGFTVRGGVRDLYFAQQLAEFATQYGVISRDEARKINAVEVDFKDVESIAKAIGNAGKVVVTVGPSEDGPRGKVTARDALQVVEAASIANVGHIVVVVETGGGSSNGGPLALLSDFFSKLFSKDAEVTTDSLLDSVVDTELNFTFVRVRSTEGVDDFSPEGENVVLLSEGTYNQGTRKVSKAQLASVVASIFTNIFIAENKVLEVATTDSGSSKPVEELLSAIPVDGRRAALAETRAKAAAKEREKKIREQAEAEAKKAVAEAKKAAALANELEEEAKKLATQEAKAAASAQNAKEKAKAAAASLEDLRAKMKEIGASIGEKSQNGFGTFFGRIGASSEEEKEEAKEEPRGDKGGGLFGLGNLFKAPFSSESATESSPRAVAKKPASRPKPTPAKPTPAKKTPASTTMKTTTRPLEARRDKKPQSPGEKKVLGGLFKQETIYIDE